MTGLVRLLCGIGLRTCTLEVCLLLYDTCIHELFERQVERTPDAYALRFKSSRVTFAELNRRANQLAHYLRRRGVGREVQVGILQQRSV